MNHTLQTQVPNVPYPTAPHTDPNQEHQSKSPEATHTLKPDTFTGMLDTSNSNLEYTYRYAPVSSEVGSTNRSTKTSLYKSRLEAQKALNERTAAEGHAGKAWNERRAAAIARGEDPNREFLETVARRRPDSVLERGWRWVRGKKATKFEQEVADRERKEKQGVEMGGEGEGSDFDGSIHSGGKKGTAGDNDGVIR